MKRAILRAASSALGRGWLTRRTSAARAAALLGERRASIQDLARDAGVAYGTAFALYHDRASRYDRDTLDKLCRYFNCTVCDILAYTPGPPADGAGSE